MNLRQKRKRVWRRLRNQIRRWHVALDTEHPSEGRLAKAVVQSHAYYQILTCKLA